MDATRDVEVFVAGGGPAGLAAAIAARQAGFQVLLADCARPPIDKACGEGIMPQGVAALQQLGVNLSIDQAPPLAGIKFIDAAGTVKAHFDGGDGRGIRRTTLHQVLVDRAAQAGVEMHWGVRVSRLMNGGISVGGHNLRCRWIVVADGQNSKLREAAGLALGSVRRQRFGFRYHYAIAPWSEFVEVYWSDCGQMYVSTVAPGEICVAFITSDLELRFEQALPRFPVLAERLGAAKPLARVLGAVTVTRRLAAVASKKIALIGDASGSVDAVTGEGLTLAFQQALALADAMRNDDLRQYQAAHSHISLVPCLMAELILTLDRHPGFRQRVFRAFAKRPDFFEQFLAIHTGARSPLSFGVSGAVSLGWHLLAA